MKTAVKHIVGYALHNYPTIQDKFKKWNELLFWKMHFRKIGAAQDNLHYEHCFTNLFGIPHSHYTGKRILDVGCGPLGSLEWAQLAARRVGIDALADDYLKLNGGKHSMEYINAESENIPFSDDYFDVVSMFNALDHVSNVEKSIVELSRVTRPGGDLLIIVEIGQKPTITEPHTISIDLIDKFSGFEIASKAVYALGSDHDIYKAIMNKKPAADSDSPGLLCCHLKKINI